MLLAAARRLLLLVLLCGTACDPSQADTDGDAGLDAPLDASSDATRPESDASELEPDASVSGDASVAPEGIGPEGGNIKLDDIEVRVPPGALSERVKLTLVRRDVALSTHALSSYVYALEPADVTFAQPVVVRFALGWGAATDALHVYAGTAETGFEEGPTIRTSKVYYGDVQRTGLLFLGRALDTGCTVWGGTETPIFSEPLAPFPVGDTLYVFDQQTDKLHGYRDGAWFAARTADEWPKGVTSVRVGDASLVFGGSGWLVRLTEQGFSALIPAQSDTFSVHGDVLISSDAKGRVLQWTGSEWTEAAPALGKPLSQVFAYKSGYAAMSEGALHVFAAGAWTGLPIPVASAILHVGYDDELLVGSAARWYRWDGESFVALPSDVCGANPTSSSHLAYSHGRSLALRCADKTTFKAHEGAWSPLPASLGQVFVDAQGIAYDVGRVQENVPIYQMRKLEGAAFVALEGPAESEAFAALGNTRRVLGDPDGKLVVVGSQRIARQSGESFELLPAAPTEWMTTLWDATWTDEGLLVGGSPDCAGASCEAEGATHGCATDADCPARHGCAYDYEFGRYCRPGGQFATYAEASWVEGPFHSYPPLRFAGSDSTGLHIQNDGYSYGKNGVFERVYSEYYDSTVYLLGMLGLGELGFSLENDDYDYVPITARVFAAGEPLETISFTDLARIQTDTGGAVLAINENTARLRTAAGWEPTSAYVPFGRVIGGTWPEIVAYNSNRGELAKRKVDGTWRVFDSRLDMFPVGYDWHHESRTWTDGQAAFFSFDPTATHGDPVRPKIIARCALP